MGISSKRKGKDGEKEAAAFLNDILGIDTARRGVNKDIDGMEGYGLHAEIKRVERIIPAALVSAVEQARQDAGTTKTPFVMARKNRGEWYIIIRAKDLKEFSDRVAKI